MKYLAEEVTDLEIPFVHEAELKLAKLLLRFSDVTLSVLETLHLHKICDYLYSLAVEWSNFYKHCYIVETKTESGKPRVNYHRLILAEVTAETMKKCFDILGIRTLEKM